MLIVLNGPSAGGKTTLLENVLAADPEIRRLLTTTTRKPRLSEVNMVDYRFVELKEFERADVNGYMVEQTVYAGNRYGVYDEDLRPFWDPRHHGIVVMDAFGYLKMVEFLGRQNVVLIFVHADFATLEQRMRERGGMTDVEITARLKQARDREFVGQAFAQVVIDTTKMDPEAAYAELKTYLHVRKTFESTCREAIGQLY